MGNKSLQSAIKAKNDEFYTQISDIEKECSNYKEHFRGKSIFCNCDDPYESNFFKHFAMSFKSWGLEKIVATCYAGSPIANKELSLFDDESEEGKTTKTPHKIVITDIPDMNMDGAVDLTDVKLLLGSDKNHLTRLNQDGDFRSQECVEILKEADIVVTNPPFSLFREFVAQLDEHQKKFLIIGNKNAITYKEIFKLIKENKMWVGYTPMGIDMLFDVPEKFAKELIANKKEGSAYKIVNGVVKGRSQSIWFTNLDHKKRHEDLFLYKKYNPKDYPTYDNYDAIDVCKVADIPADYEGVMGVPISFLDKYNPQQFELIGSNRGVDQDPNGIYGRGSLIGGKETFKRLFIKRKK
ncbi:MAG: adenine-specific methyltransferase EcoRI family protein [Spirochaetes bacterium]|nr:adenine-specific methyltransferase EcoRI family protein [Spirochaetota bacterium]